MSQFKTYKDASKVTANGESDSDDDGVNDDSGDDNDDDDVDNDNDDDDNDDNDDDNDDNDDDQKNKTIMITMTSTGTLHCTKRPGKDSARPSPSFAKPRYFSSSSSSSQFSS